MKWQIFYGLLLVLRVYTLYASEFLYPVAAQDRWFYLIYQKTPHHIELWRWDYYSKHAEQLLFSRFTPAGVRLLPSGDGFSFIDNGMLKVKKFLKRSPRTIEFDAPIYQVEVVHWIDNTTCYTSARYQDNMGIFQLDYEGEVTPIYFKESIDCLYPQKINDQLFYIERDESWHYRIIKTPYLVAEGETFQERCVWYWNHSPVFHEIMVFQKPMIFLYMQSEHEGFVISHPTVLNRIDTTITFEYYHLKQEESEWQYTLLFSFNIPTDLLFIGSASRLYESMLPLLPKHYGNQIFFASSNSLNQSILSLYVYDLSTASQMVLSDSYNLFPPIKQVSGGSLQGKVRMYVDGRTGIKIDLAEVDLGKVLT